MCLYFAYGSNMNKARMKKRDVKFTQMFSGIMRNWQLTFNKVNTRKEGSGFANIVPKESSIVEGIIYKINEKSIEKLDDREGFCEHYQRLDMLVESEGKFLKCVIYIANPTKVREGLKPEKWYLDHLLEGEEFLSTNYISFLKKIPIL